MRTPQSGLRLAGLGARAGWLVTLLLAIGLLAPDAKAAVPAAAEQKPKAPASAPRPKAIASPPARPAPAPRPAVRAHSDSYVLGVGDLVRIQVYGEPDLTLQVRLESKGSISYPFLGEIRVVGRPVAEVREHVMRGLADGYLKKPEVQVLVTEYRSFFVNGEVRRPGGYPFMPGLTVQKAVAVAGGMTERASTRKMYLVKENDPRAKRIKVDINTAVMPGDTLIIEEGVF